jgi:hypothetical protein
MLEVTEEGLFDPDGTALTTLDALRHMGIRIAIDDYGAGYSSLSRMDPCPRGRPRRPERAGSQLRGSLIVSAVQGSYGCMVLLAQDARTGSGACG